MNNNYGTVNFEGKEYTLTENAEFCGVQYKRIGNSIYVLNENNYSDPCVDMEGNEYVAYFVLNNPDAEEIEDMCDWDSASYVEKI